MIFHTNMEEKIKALFFNETLKRWHFEEIIKESRMSRERANYFLRELLKEDFIKRIKPRGKMPYYLANRDSIKFRNKKRLYGLSIIEKSGLFEHLSRIKNIKTAILFGSYSRGDWSKSSDIDILIDFNKTKTLFDLSDVQSSLEAILNKKVDLVLRTGVKKQLLPYIQKDLTTVYEKD